jgi:hypothetical protein
MTTVVNGLLGGAASGLLALGVLGLFGVKSKATALLTALVGERGRSEPFLATAVALYGGVAGALFVVAVQRLVGGPGVPPTAVDAFGAALAWAAVLALATVALARRARPDGVDGAGVRAAVVAYGAYGTAMALWVRLTWVA